MDILLAHLAQSQTLETKRSRPLAIIPWGPWVPDAPEFEAPGCSRAEGVFPWGPHGYRSFAGLSAYSGAMSARCQGAYTVAGSDGFTIGYAGDATDLYRLVDTTWTNASKSAAAYTVSADEFWEFLKFDNTILATAIGNAVQGMTIGGSAFADQFTSTLLPQARHLARVRRFLVLGNTRESGTDFPTRVRWGQIDSVVNMDESAAQLSDAQDIDGDGGWVQRIIGGDRADIFQERMIQRMEFVGSPDVFRFDPVELYRGTIAPYSVIPYGRFRAYLAPDGFFIWDGFQSIPISEGKVTKWFFDNANASYYFRCVGAVFPRLQCLAWAFVSTTAASTNPDHILLYHVPSGWWGVAPVVTEWLFNDLSKGLTLDQLDTVSASLDALPFSLDSRFWTGGVPQTGAFDSSHRLSTFTGSNLAVILETQTKQLSPGQRTKLKAVEPLIDGGSPTIAQATQQNLTQTQTFGSGVAMNTDGRCPLHSNARYHAFRMEMAAASTFTHSQGLRPYGSSGGTR